MVREDEYRWPQVGLQEALKILEELDNTQLEIEGFMEKGIIQSAKGVAYVDKGAWHCY
jgi:hypothetical protein